jgi:hypothetical protein
VRLEFFAQWLFAQWLFAQWLLFWGFWLWGLLGQAGAGKKPGGF